MTAHALTTRSIRFGFSRLQAFAFVEAMTRPARPCRPFTAEDVHDAAVELDAINRFLAALRADAKAGVGDVAVTVPFPAAEHEALLRGDVGADGWIGGSEEAHWSLVILGVDRTVTAIKAALFA